MAYSKKYSIENKEILRIAKEFVGDMSYSQAWNNRVELCCKLVEYFPNFPQERVERKMYKAIVEIKR